MSYTRNDGGPAFPQHGWSKDPETVKRMQEFAGLSIRDWFAGQALIGQLAACADPQVDLAPCTGAAELSYKFADAMLAARSKVVAKPEGSA